MNEAADNPNLCAACSQMAIETIADLEFEATQMSSKPAAFFDHPTEAQNAS